MLKIDRPTREEPSDGHQLSRHTSALESYARARATLEAGLAAVGGVEAIRAAGAIRRRLTGDWIGSGQHPRPRALEGPTLTPPPSNGKTDVVSAIAYQTTRSHETSRWVEESVESDGKGNSVTRVTTVDGNTGSEALAYYREPLLVRRFTPDEARSLDVRKRRRYPEGALLMALDRAETLEWLGSVQEFGRPHDVIAFSDRLGTRVRLYFDAHTRLLSKSETLREHPIAGDTTAETIYLDYRQVETLRLPFHYLERIAGVPVEDLRATAIDTRVPLPADGLPVSGNVVPMEPTPSGTSVERVSDGLYLIHGPYNVAFAEFQDHVIVIEAPLDSRYAEDCLALINETVPGKPVRRVVATHYHYDHVAGLRPFIARDIPIVTTPDARETIERLAASTRTMYPDALARTPRRPRIEAIDGSRLFEDETNRLELYDIGPIDHAGHIIVGYLPKARVLFQADLWDPVSRTLNPAGPDAILLARAVHDRALRVDRVISVHGPLLAWTALERALEVRARYVR
ncbi:MAG TPA: MBL fold metallo-hydrolase [Vicinamibacterales bacterium]|nr:MBL fold metallo-hydrolase [Vicinamibacterales bacterium]